MGGIDTQTAEYIVGNACGITLPRVEGDKYYGITESCGGHTMT